MKKKKNYVEGFYSQLLTTIPSSKRQLQYVKLIQLLLEADVCAPYYSKNIYIFILDYEY